jgi:hypothetical protein
LRGDTKGRKTGTLSPSTKKSPKNKMKIQGKNKMTVHTQRSTFHKKLEEAHHSGWRNFSHPGREHHHSAKGTKCGSLARGFQKFSLFLNEKPPMSYSSLGGKNKIIFITSLTK